MCVCACVYVVYMYMRVFDNTYMSSARTRVTRVRASVRIQRMVKMRELAREVRDSERTDERRPPPPAHRPSATQPILCHLKQKARFPLLVFTSALSSPPLPSSPPHHETNVNACKQNRHLEYISKPFQRSSYANSKIQCNDPPRPRFPPRPLPPPSPPVKSYKRGNEFSSISSRRALRF